MRVLVIVLALSLGLAAGACDPVKSESDAGAAAFERHDYDGAIQHLTKAIELKPDLPDSYFLRGLAYDHKGLSDQAIADVTKTIEFKPGYSDAYDSRAGIYEKLGQRDKAIADYRKALSLKPDSKRSQEALKRLGAKP